MAAAQYTDPAVSRTKFDREIAEFRALNAEYRRRGWFLVEAEFPHILVLLATAKPKPPAIATAVQFDYSNYDAAPPSVRLVNPFTGDPYKWSELPTPMMRALPEQQLALAGGLEGAAAQFAVQPQQPYMQAHGPDEIPFLCVAGVREYHEHPAHTGDLWELHRAKGAGRLVRLLEIISRYGVEPINGLQVQLIPKIVGFSFGPPPA